MMIRQAVPEDAAGIAVVNDVVQKIHAEAYPEVFKNPTDPQEVTTFFREKVQEKDNFVFVAYVGDQLIGYVWFAVEQRRENPFKFKREMVYIHQIAVSFNHRHKGIGRALMDKVEVFAREQGIRNIALDSWSFNHGAHRFFEKVGIGPYNIKMEKILEYSNNGG
ncbi:MAG: GNAT family N-acetyltransferase [Thermodesulfobacteriota bacterium]